MSKNKVKSEEKTLEILRDLGGSDGVEFTMGVGDRVDYYYSNKIEPPVGLAHDLKIEISSTERDNKELLHHLLQKTNK